jgi:hypothetical protein
VRRDHEEAASAAQAVPHRLFLLGLFTHLRRLAGFDAAQAAQTFELPAQIAPIVVIAVGTQAPAEQLEGVLLEREIAPRQRKDLSEIVLAGLPS